MPYVGIIETSEERVRQKVRASTFTGACGNFSLSTFLSENEVRGLEASRRRKNWSPQKLFPDGESAEEKLAAVVRSRTVDDIMAGRNVIIKKSKLGAHFQAAIAGGELTLNFDG